MNHAQASYLDLQLTIFRSRPITLIVQIDQLTAAGAKTADYIRNMQQQLDQARAAASTPSGGGVGRRTTSTPEGSPSQLQAAVGADGEVVGGGDRRALELLQRELQTTKEEAARTSSDLQTQVWNHQVWGKSNIPHPSFQPVVYLPLTAVRAEGSPRWGDIRGSAPLPQPCGQ